MSALADLPAFPGLQADTPQDLVNRSDLCSAYVWIPAFGGARVTEPPHILIVEDDAGVVEGLVRGLKRVGFETSLAMAGDEGLERILSERFDLVLLDLMLPGQTGFQVLEALRTRTSVPVIVLSARTDLPSRLESFDLGAVDSRPIRFRKALQAEFFDKLLQRIV